MLRLITAASILFFPISASAADVAFDMRGAVLGMALDAFRSVPIPNDADSVDKIDPEVSCKEIKDDTACEWKAASSYSKYKSQMYTRIGDGGGFATFTFSTAADGLKRLRRIEVRSNMDYLDGMLPPMLNKFGQAEVHSEPIQNAYGAQFESSTYTWRNSLSTIELRTRCVKINLLCLTYSHLELESAANARERNLRGDPNSKL